MLRQTPRTFVERARLPHERPAASVVRGVVTDLGVLEPRRRDGELTLTSVHPGVDVEQAREATGWDLRIADDLGVTAPPTARRADRAAGARSRRRTA